MSPLRSWKQKAVVVVAVIIIELVAAVAVVVILVVVVSAEHNSLYSSRCIDVGACSCLVTYTYAQLLDFLYKRELFTEAPLWLVVLL
ncbi:hypothetical protein ElyMa_000166000 [Elysia marginata]|uniref:Uncharacterized protein n=1 Tax=Elysia marginata TaxID=1093978 RepID=A0AAV4EU28_9GAST|nr:hypothetical protein ElyMa_000166000 [Elysia marginata]